MITFTSLFHPIITFHFINLSSHNSIEISPKNVGNNVEWLAKSGVMLMENDGGVGVVMGIESTVYGRLALLQVILMMDDDVDDLFVECDLWDEYGVYLVNY